MKFTTALIALVTMLSGLNVLGQNEIAIGDTIQMEEAWEEVKVEQPKLTRFLIPKKAAMFSAAFPGLGQAYNHKYWKLPFVYAAIGATAYGIWWNNDLYVDYRDAYIDIRDSDPMSVRYLDVLPPGYDFDEQTSDWYSWFESQLEKKKDSYRRDRDLLVLVMVGVYVLNIIDANVDAHLSDFDIGNDLSMNIAPTIIGRDQYGVGNSGFGMSLKLKF